MEHVVMRVVEAIANRARDGGRRVRVSGYLVAGVNLAYLVEDAAVEHNGEQQPAILLPEPGLADSVMSAGYSPCVGSMVVVADQATITGCIASHTGFSMFPAALTAVTDVEVSTRRGEIRARLREPRFALALDLDTAPTVRQVRVLHRIMQPNQNHLEFRSQLAAGGRHVIARARSRPDVDDLANQLSEVGLRSVLIDYEENF